MAFLTTNILDTLNRDFIGAKHLTDQLNSFYEGRTQSVAFPPYNIIEIDEGKSFIIELAVAGFAKDEIEIKHEDNYLYVNGEINRENRDKVTYIHCGIAARNFERKFLLRDNIRIIGAEYNDGILSIKMERIEPEKEKSKLITIK